jgi:hypothetical protein
MNNAVAGRFVMRDRRITTADETAVLARSRDAAEVLWDRIRRRWRPPLRP